MDLWRWRPQEMKGKPTCQEKRRIPKSLCDAQILKSRSPRFSTAFLPGCQPRGHRNREGLPPREQRLARLGAKESPKSWCGTWSRSSRQRLASATRTARPAQDLRSALPRRRRRTGADSIPPRAHLCTNDGALPRLYPANRLSRERPDWNRARTLKPWFRKGW
jgi:hypothetical protein